MQPASESSITSVAENSQLESLAEQVLNAYVRNVVV